MKLFLRLVSLGLVIMATCTLCFADELVPKEKSLIKFEYEMGGKAAQKLEADVARLTKGTSLDVVKNLLGKPTSERTLHTKQLLGGGKFIAKEITYVLKRVHMNDDNVNDHVINLFFDQNNLLTEAERLGYSVTGSYEILGGVQIREKIL
jgi:hypothetical protein